MEQGPQGLYLKPPHGELSHSGVKTALAKAREFGFEGQPFALCSGLYGYGDLVLGDPEAVGVDEFDARFSEHRVSVKERLKWWPDVTELFLYAYKEWVPYGKPRRVEVPAQVQTLMGPIRFLDEEAGMGEGVVINVNTAGAAPKVTEDVALMKAMAGDGEAIAELEEGEGLKVWAPADATGHTEAADTPKKKRQWASTANSARSTCIDAISGKATAAQIKACEGKAVRIANDAVKSASENPDGEKDIKVKDLRSEKAQGEMDLMEINEAVWEAINPPRSSDATVGVVNRPYPRDVDVYDSYVTYELEGKNYVRTYTIVDGKAQLGEAVEAEVIVRPVVKAFDEGYKAELIQEFDALELGDKVLGDDEKAALTSAQRRALPNSAYAWVETGEGCEKVDGKTPEKCRHLPYKKADGSLDCARVRNARARIPQMSGVPQAATDKIEGAQKKCTKEKSLSTSLRAQANKALEGMVGLWRAVTGDDKLLEGETGFKAFKGVDGKTYILTWTTNAFMDRDGEIFTTKSIEDYADRAWQEIQTTGSKGQYDCWHIPGSEFADIMWAGAEGRYLVEMGTFHNDGVGKAFETFFTECPEAQKEIAPDGWGVSHKFTFRPGDRDDGVFDWFDKSRTSVLSIHRAANPYTAMEVLQMSLDEEQINVLKTIGEAADVDLLSMVQEAGAASKTLEEAGVAHKSADEKPAGEQEAAEKPASEDSDETADVPVNDVAQRVAQIMGLKELSEMLQDINGRLTEVEKGDEEKGKRLIEVEKGDDTRLAEKKAWQPSVVWLRPSTANSTLLDESKDKGLTDKKPRVPNAIQQVSKTILGNPVAGGRTS